MKLLPENSIITNTENISLKGTTETLALVKSDDDTILWQVPTPRAITKCVMQNDGNVIILDAEDKALWDSGTWNGASAKFTFEDGGDLCIHKWELYYFANWKNR